MSENNVADRLQERRIVSLGNEIDQPMVDGVRKRILELSLQSDEEIRLFIDSNGGGARSSHILYDFIK